MKAHLVLACCTLAALSAAAAPKSTKLTSVYNLAYAAAILDICAASPATAADAARSKEIAELSARLSALVKTMGVHYKDAELSTIYDSTRRELADDDKLKRRVRVVRGDCGERSIGEMRAYVGDNEASIGAAIERSRKNASHKAAPAAPAK